MKRRWSLFTYPVMDLKAAEAMLCRRAEEGWRLEKVWLGIVASFVPAEEPVTYCIDWADPKDGDSQDYTSLLADAGWTLRQQVAYRKIYEAPAGTPPIQTDSELEYQRFRRKVLRRMGFGVTILVLDTLIMLTNGHLELAFRRPALWAMESAAALHMYAVLMLFLPLLLLGGVAWLGRMALRLWQWRRASREGEPFPVPGSRSAAVAKVCSLAGWFWAALFFLSIPMDVIAGRLPVLPVAGLLALIGIAWSVTTSKRADQRKWRKWGAFCLALAMLCLGGRAALGQTVEEALVEPPMKEAHLLPETTVMWAHRTGSDLLLSCTSWDEMGPEDLAAKGRLATEFWDTTLGSRMVTHFWADAWTARWPWLAGWVTATLWEPGMERVDGYEQVWLSEEDGAQTWLIRRGDTLLRVENRLEPLDESWLDRTLKEMEGAR